MRDLHSMSGMPNKASLILQSSEAYLQSLCYVHVNSMKHHPPTRVGVIVKQCSYRKLNTRTGIQIPGMCGMVMPEEYILSRPPLVLCCRVYKRDSAWH